jgi:hypothetical protein
VDGLEVASTGFPEVDIRLIERACVLPKGFTTEAEKEFDFGGKGEGTRRHSQAERCLG